MLQCYYQVKLKGTYGFKLWTDTSDRYQTFDKLTSVWDHRNHSLIGEVDNE